MSQGDFIRKEGIAPGHPSSPSPGMPSLRFLRSVLGPFLAVSVAAPAALALEADLLPSDPAPVLQEPTLAAGGERQTEALARYLQALLEEETLGPDQSLATKRSVLALEPGFTELAMEVAHQYLRRGDVPEALSVLKDAAKAAPRRIEPPVALAGIYLRQLLKPELAEKYGNQALAAGPDDAAPYLVLYDIYKSTGQTARLENLFSKALKRSPRSADFWLDLADLRLRERSPDGDRASVEILLGRAQDAAGDSPEALARVADYFSAIELPDRAIPLYQTALAVKPSLEGTREKLAALLLQKGDPSEAASLLEEMIKSDPLNLRAYDQLAEVYLKAGDLSRSLANMRQGLLLAPADPRRFDHVIRLSLTTNDAPGALKAATEAEKLFPGVLEFSLYRALALSGTQEHEQALKIFERLLVEAGNFRPGILDADFFFSYAVAAEQSGYTVKAAELFKKSIELDPASAARAYNYLGYMWADRGENLDEAEQMIRRALEAEPDNGAFLDSLGWVLFRQGRTEEALEQLLLASERLAHDPDPVVLEHLGDAYEKLGKFSEAISSWQKSLQLDPENPALVKKLDARSARIVKTPARSKPAE